MRNPFPGQIEGYCKAPKNGLVAAGYGGGSSNLTKDFVTESPPSPPPAPSFIFIPDDSLGTPFPNAPKDGVVIGNLLYSLSSTSRVLSSADVKHWTNLGVTGTAPQGIAFGVGTIVVVNGNNQISYSTNLAVSFTTITIASMLGHMNKVVFANATFVAVGDNNQSATSPDGINWTTHAITTGPDRVFQAVTYGNGMFIATGFFRSIYSSPDGASWTARNDPLSGGSLDAVTFDGSRFISVGQNGLVYTSPDGLVWTQHIAALPGSVRGRGVAGVPSLALAINDNEEVCQSTDGGATWSVLTTGSKGQVGNFIKLFNSANNIYAVGDRAPSP
jgi:photosystem II stability/assembly factor-like uncharacterized protein